MLQCEVIEMSTKGASDVTYRLSCALGLRLHHCCGRSWHVAPCSQVAYTVDIASKSFVFIPLQSIG